MQTKHQANEKQDFYSLLSDINTALLNTQDQVELSKLEWIKSMIEDKVHSQAKAPTLQ